MPHTRAAQPLGREHREPARTAAHVQQPRGRPQLARLQRSQLPPARAGRAQLVVPAGQRGEVDQPAGAGARRASGPRRRGSAAARPARREAPRSRRGRAAPRSGRTPSAPRAGSVGPCSAWTCASAPASSPGRPAPAAPPRIAVQCPVSPARPLSSSGTSLRAPAGRRRRRPPGRRNRGACRPRTRPGAPAAAVPAPARIHHRARFERHRSSVLQLARTAARTGTPSGAGRLHVEPTGPDVLTQRVAEAGRPVVGWRTARPGSRRAAIASPGSSSTHLHLVGQPADHRCEAESSAPTGRAGRGSSAAARDRAGRTSSSCPAGPSTWSA